MTSHDQLAKNLFRNFFSDFLRLAAPDVAAQLRLDGADFQDKQEFTDWPAGERREMDLLAAIPILDRDADGSETHILIHIEIEAEARAGMAERLWQYYMQLRLRHGRTVVPLLVNLRGGKPGVHREELSEGFGEPATARFSYRAFSLSGCLSEEYLSRPEPLAWALAALMRPGRWSRAEQKIECLRRIALADLPTNDRFLLGNWVETYLQLDERDLAEYERLRDLVVNTEVRAMEMTWAEKMEVEYTEKGVQRGLQQGVAQGIAQGVAQGVEALHRVVLRLLSQRFGAVPETVQRKVEAIDSMDSLSNLAAKVLEAKSIDDMGL